MLTSSPIKKQLRYAYLYSFFAYCGITQLWVIYLGQMGLSLVQIGLCESIFHISSMLFELPSGVLADRFTYKRMLNLSRVAALISSAMMLWQGGFWWFALSFVISAWSYNLQSGTLEALVFESLKEVDQTSLYAKVTSKMNAIIEVTSTGGLIFAGLLTQGHMVWAYWIALILAILGIFSVFKMKEPKNHQDYEQTNTIVSIIKNAVSLVKNDRNLLSLMLFDGVIQTLISTYYFYFQNEMVVHSFPSWLVTLCLAGSALAAVIAISMSPRLLKLPQRSLLLGLTSLLAVSLLAAFNGQKVVLGIIFFITYGITALIPPVFSVYYNEKIPSEQRATLLSVASLIFSVTMVVMFPLMGWVVSKISFSVAFGFLGIIVLFATFWLAYLTRRSKTKASN